MGDPSGPTESRGAVPSIERITHSRKSCLTLTIQVTIFDLRDLTVRESATHLRRQY